MSGVDARELLQALLRPSAVRHAACRRALAEVPQTEDAAATVLNTFLLASALEVAGRIAAGAPTREAALRATEHAEAAMRRHLETTADQSWYRQLLLCGGDAADAVLNDRFRDMLDYIKQMK